MSMHIIQDTNSDTVVRIGYDRALDYVHCTAMRDGEVVYSNLSDPDAGTEQQEVEYYHAVLAEHGITLPQQVCDEVTRDQLEGTGNRVAEYRLPLTQTA